MLHLTEFSFVSAAEQLPNPAYSFADDWDTTIYTPQEFADAVAQIDWLTTQTPGPPWHDWKAVWRHQDESITIDMLPCEIDPANDIRSGLAEYWGGSPIEIHCELSRFIDLWHIIRRSCPAVCIHNTDCRLYTPDQFCEIHTNSNNA